MTTLSNGCITCGEVSSGSKGPFGFCSMDCAYEAPSLKWTPGLAYLSGLVAADGCLHERANKIGRSISFVSIEPNLIKTVYQLAEASGSTPHLGGGGVTSAGNVYERVRWTDYRMYATFMRLGLHPAKSKTMKALSLPIHVESGSDFFWLFLRGLFEGDGTVTVHKETGTPREIKFITGSPEFSTWLQRQLYLRGVYEVTEFSAWEGHKDARVFSIATKHTHFMRRKMYDEWEELFGELGHPKKKQRLSRKRIHIDSRPWQQKMRYSLPKIEASFLLCYNQLKRWPNSKEYETIRADKIKGFTDPRDFPSSSMIFVRFKKWEKAVLHMERTQPELPNNKTLYIERSLLRCHQELGRWPQMREYDAVRKKIHDCPARSKEFVTARTVAIAFSGWRTALDHMRKLHPELADPSAFSKSE